MFRTLPRTACALGCVLLALTGCGKRDATLAEVRGDVTFCGQPAVAEVLFEPLSEAGQSAGQASMATSDEAGRFRLRLDESKTGARIGRHRVTIRVQRLSASRGSDGKSGDLPEGLSGALKSTRLARDVHAGDNEFHFRLTF